MMAKQVPRIRSLKVWVQVQALPVISCVLWEGSFTSVSSSIEQGHCSLPYWPHRTVVRLK